MARVDAHTFINAWVDAYESGGNQSTVAEILGCSSANVSTRAKKLRDAGVELPELVSGRGKGVAIDVAALNERLAERLANA